MEMGGRGTMEGIEEEGRGKRRGRKGRRGKGRGICLVLV